MDRGVADRVATATLESVGGRPDESQDELIPVPQPTTPARKLPAQEKTASARPAPAPKPAAPARPAPAPAPKPAAAPAPAPAPIADDDERVITAVELGEAPIGSDGGELTDELELADIEGLEIEEQSDSLFDTPGTDLADDEVS
jgi:hypothetical protein